MTPRVLIEPARLAGSSVLRCQTDERLVDLVRAGNDRAFEAIVDRYRRPLVRYCSRVLPTARAEDAVQQAFMNAFAALRRDEKRIELRPWLYRIAHNASLNALRESGWAHEAIEAAAHRAAFESAHDVAERRASLRTVVTAVQDLPQRQRDAIVLRELEGRSYEQIAVELDATGGAVRQLLNRARHTLRAAATALTPASLLTRLPWGPGAPVLDRVTEAASHDGLRVGAARLGGALVASVAVAGGLSEAPKHLRGVRHPAPAAPRIAQARPATAPHLIPAAPGPGRISLPRDVPRIVLEPPPPEPRAPKPDASPAPPDTAPTGAFAPRSAPAAAVAPAPAAAAPSQDAAPTLARAAREDRDRGDEAGRDRSGREHRRHRRHGREERERGDGARGDASGDGDGRHGARGSDARSTNAGGERSGERDRAGGAGATREPRERPARSGPVRPRRGSGRASRRSRRTPAARGPAAPAGASSPRARARP
jgi:RNA polymerase sigma factor (sigma-70 family)